MNINPPEWEGYTEATAEGDDMQLTDFENLILIKSFREEKVCIIELNEIIDNQRDELETQAKALNFHDVMFVIPPDALHFGTIGLKNQHRMFACYF